MSAIPLESLVFDTAGFRRAGRPGWAMGPVTRLRQPRQKCGKVGVVNHRDRIVRDPLICGGEPVIKGTRVTLRTLLASLADGDSIQDILTDYPTLTADDVRAVIAIAADSVREDLPAPKVVGF